MRCEENLHITLLICHRIYPPSHGTILMSVKIVVFFFAKIFRQINHVSLKLPCPKHFSIYWCTQLSATGKTESETQGSL